jgi:hypothetical protein
MGQLAAPATWNDMRPLLELRTTSAILFGFHPSSSSIERVPAQLSSWRPGFIADTASALIPFRHDSLPLLGIADCGAKLGGP